MRSRALGLVSVLVILGPGLAGCASLDPGPRATQQRAVQDVSVVELATGGSLHVELGSTPSLTITAGEQVIDRLTADVDAGLLRLGTEGDSSDYSGEIRYDLVISALSSIRVLGSGDASVDFSGTDDPEIIVKGSGGVEARGVDADTLALTIDGSGDIDVADAFAREVMVRLDGSGSVRIDGTVTAQDTELRGSGEYSAADLQSVDARVVVRGPGEATVSASGTLDAVIAGSGEISYSGNPHVTKEISGSGEVNRT